jgi:hypothetical protein
MKPIEPGCVCRIVQDADYSVVPRNVGKIVIVEDRADAFHEDLIGRRPAWLVRMVASSGETWLGESFQRGIVAAANLIRLDDDPDAAEPRIAEREIEHA